MLFFFSLPPNLIQQSSYKGHCVRRRDTSRAWCVFVLNVLSSGKSHTHSVCRYIGVGTLQPKQQPFKQAWLVGGWEGLLVNWQHREYRALSPARSPTPMLSFPFLPLTIDRLHCFSLASINLPLKDVICSLSVLSLSLPRLHTFFF